MVSFKEGLYTVEFQESIALLQAFVISIAILHSRSLTKHQAEVNGLQEPVVADLGNKASAQSKGGVQTSYVPNYPPLSPVGRA